MKRYFPLLLLPMMWILTGCPVSVDYPLGLPGQEKLDERLFGTWRTADTTAEVPVVRFTHGEGNSFNVTVLERGSMYAEEVDNFKGWCTELNGKQFVYFQDAADSKAGFYTYTYWFDGKDLMVADFTLKIGGTDAVTSTENYRKEVEGSMAYPDWLGTTFRYTKK